MKNVLSTKKSKIIFFSIIGVILIGVLVLINVNAQKNAQKNAPKTGPAYQYPIVPGTDKWKSFTTNDQKLSACQIPQNVLKKMSTENLIKTIRDYPLLPNVYVWNSISEGIQNVKEGFNGLQELYRRKYAGDTEAIKGVEQLISDIEDYSVISKTASEKMPNINE